MTYSDGHERVGSECESQDCVLLPAQSLTHS